jgi:hypothetical protein
LLGALRLPNTAFKANAGTDVTTDILFLQKRSLETSPRCESWIELRSIETEDGPLRINEYFARNPEMMLGRMGLESAQYGTAPALIGNLEPGDLEKAVSRLPASVYKTRDSYGPKLREYGAQVLERGEIKEGGLTDHDGHIVVRRGDTFAPPPSVRGRIRGMIRVRDAVREVFRTQLADARDEAIVEARRHLNREYDFFVSRFGALYARENVKAFARGSGPSPPTLA